VFVPATRQERCGRGRKCCNRKMEVTRQLYSSSPALSVTRDNGAGMKAMDELTRYLSGPERILRINRR
jgi:hypothetical protein